MNIRSSMKKILTLISILSLGMAACERHPVSQLPQETETQEKTAKASQSKTTDSAPEASASGTPKTYFPQHSR
jgi:hypothetical protein